MFEGGIQTFKNKEKRRQIRPNDNHCRYLKYFAKACRLLDERYFAQIIQAIDDGNDIAFLNICMNDLGLEQKVAEDFWARIRCTGPPDEGW